MTLALVRIARLIGWTVLAASAGLVCGWLIWEAARGPVADQAIWPVSWLWLCFVTSVKISGAAMVLAALFAALPAAGLSIAPRGMARRVLTGLIISPLLLMPSMFGYAWMLLCTSRVAGVRRVMDGCGFNSADNAWRGAAIALAAWLWPIFALTLAACVRRLGREPFQLASLDAGPLRALVRGVLPSMSAPVCAAAAVTFLLAMTDATIPPLVGASQVWSVEMKAAAGVAGKYDRPSAYLFWNAWPMVLLAGLLASAAWPGVRRVASWGFDAPAGEVGVRSPRSSWVLCVATLTAGGLALWPLGLFAWELASGRDGFVQAFRVAARTMGHAGLATSLVSTVVGLLGVAISVALLHEPDWPAWRRWVALCGMGLTGVVAILPPELSGSTLVRFYSWATDPRTWGRAAGWSLYDDTPWTWSAALICRFSFIAVMMVWFVMRRQGDELDAQARVEGAGRLERLAVVRWPALRSTAAACGVILVGLSLSEVSVSVLTQPPRFFGGSLAAAIDAQMHYGRQDETIASAMFLMSATLLIAMTTPGLLALVGGKERPAQAPVREKDVSGKGSES